MSSFESNEMTLRIQKPKYYDGTFPHYNLPLEIGCYSIDSNGKYCNDEHQMKYLSMPDRLTDLHMDLNEGYDDYIPIYEDTQDTFCSILRWILSNQDQVRKHFEDNLSSNTKIDFITFRGSFSRISSAIYEKSEDFKIYATKFRSVIYFMSFITEQKIETDKEMYEKQPELSTWGFKFEQCMTADYMYSKPDTSVPVNENEKYYSVVKGKLRNHRILFAGEVDGVDPKHFSTFGHDPASVLRYTELKTSRIITSGRQKWNFYRHKLMKWYLQSFFMGIPQVICGFRDDEGIVRKLGVFNVRDMPKIADNLWSPAACLNFCCTFLDCMKQWVVKDDPKVVYKIYWKPGSDIVCGELEKEYRLLPEWYTERVTAL